MDVDKILQDEARRLENLRKNAKKHYYAHKDELLAKQKKYREEKKEKVRVAREQANLPPPQITPFQRPPIQQDETIIIIKKKKTKKNTFSLDINTLRVLFDGLDKADMTKKKYKDDLVILFRILNVDNLKPLIKTPQTIFDVIDNSKAQNGADYSNNTKKGLALLLLIICDNGWNGEDFKEKNHNIFKSFFDKYDFLTRQQTKDNNNIVYHDIDDYVERVKDKFGEMSKQFLIAMFYKESPRRDDFQLCIINDVSNATDSKINYISVPQDGVCSTIINEHKTGKVYDPLIKNLSPYLSKLIKHYMILKSLKTGDFLFGKGRLTAYVSKMSSDIGLKGITINTLRKMAVTKYLNVERTIDERQALASEFGHSLGMQENVYRGRL